MNINKSIRIIIAALVVATLSACTSIPTGPTIGVMPAVGKPFDVFKTDDKECRAFAAENSEGTSSAAVTQGVTTTAIGAALGAVAGAVIGGGSHIGVGTGAGVGLLGGAAVGAYGSSGKQNQSQLQYNQAYKQCMYAKGNQTPM